MTVEPIKPAPIVTIANWPETRVTVRLCSAARGGPMLIVRRGTGQHTRMRIVHQGSWTEQD